MTAKKGVFSQFPRSFWAANTMEIFERMGWYGFYAVSSLYLTGSIEDGGLGFSSADRGVIQGLATFFLYLFPAVFGALADRYGYKRMFLASAVVTAPSLPAAFITYWLLALPWCLFPGGGRSRYVQAGCDLDGGEIDQRGKWLGGFWHFLHDGQCRWIHRPDRGGYRPWMELESGLLLLGRVDHRHVYCLFAGLPGTATGYRC